ncbi:hypothetical protein [Phenylobacterium sp.]|uniref:hypothetical protein n=1 Tax=Phenylobacterium sp. TaxID=1871053 RepID=UPI0035B3CEE2
MSGVDVRFVAGLDDHSTFPDIVRDAGLDQRFGVIQDTYVPGATDGMVFDEPLWNALVEFVLGSASDGVLTVCPSLDRMKEQAWDRFLAAWLAQAPEDRDPPDALFLRRADKLVLSLITDPWYAIGGPPLYHDSYAYSLFSSADLGPQVQAHLRQANLGGQWALSEEVVRVSRVRPGAQERLQKAFSLDWLKPRPKA